LRFSNRIAMAYSALVHTNSRELRLILASQSPRRSELLRAAGFEFGLSPSQISEILNESLNLPDQICDLARRKAEACLNSGKHAKGQGNLILAADTVVVLDGQILGKPESRQENEQHLGRLSGRVHEVITAVCLCDMDTGRVALDHAFSEIEFRVLSSDEITDYAASGEGLDKAGDMPFKVPLVSLLSASLGPTITSWDFRWRWSKRC
jgi:septum formation protein